MLRTTTIVLVAAACGCAAVDDPRLWQGSRFTVSERDRAVLRGMDFIQGMAQSSSFFDENIGDLLWCFYTIEATSPDPMLVRVAHQRGVELARRWHNTRPSLPVKPRIGIVWELASTLHVAECLGQHDDLLRAQLEPEIARFSAEAWLGFDPRVEPPPTMRFFLEEEEACIALGLPDADCPDVAVETTDLDIFYDAMITTYFGDRFGVTHGATFEQFAEWLPHLYPYPTRDDVGEEKFYDLIYTVTHIVYTFNDYGEQRLDPQDFREELSFLFDNFYVPLEDGDGETFAEFVDSLKSFGISANDSPDVARAVETLMATQNADGSWGEGLADPYDRFHTTWTAIEALRDHEFQQ